MTGTRSSLPQPAIVRTQRLTLDTSAQLARTAEPVTLGFGPYAIAATGLRADLKAETLRLESEVNGRFNP
jgi:LPS export ABC transporter protein LptC